MYMAKGGCATQQTSFRLRLYWREAICPLALFSAAGHVESHILQVAQLSQRDRAAGWVSNGQKWKTGTERQYLRTI